MASPFKFFRVHQTELLVVIGLLTMVAFIILPSVLQQMEVVGRSAATSKVVETQKYGSLSTFDVIRLKERQRVLMGFFSRLNQAYQTKMNELYRNQDQGDIQDLYALYYNSMKARQLLAQVGDSSDRTVVMVWLLENKAKEMGISISDSRISSFIIDITQGLDKETVNLLVYGDDPNNSKAVENSLVNALYGYLLRKNLFDILDSSWNVSTTGENIDSFCRMNQKANVEIFPVKVKDFVSKVAEPSETEIKTFFEQYKDDDAVVNSSKPGLRQPQKVVLEYCFGSYPKFMDVAAITDEQVQKNYEENKENYVIEKKDDKQDKSVGELSSLLEGVNQKQYRPLDDTLKEEIRQALARVAAMEKLRNAIGVVQKAMNDYSNAKDLFEMSSESEKAVAIMPEKVNFEVLAKNNGLEYANTGLMTYQSFSETPLSQLRLEGVDQSVYASSVFFNNKSPFLFQSQVFSNPEGELFVVWKTENVDEHTPTLEEEGVKEQTIDQIKLCEARKLAESEAQKLVDKAVSAQKPTPLPLKSCLGDAAFVPPQFTWMTLGPVFSPNMMPRIFLSPIEGVQDAGFDFMATIFQMKPGEIKSIANSSESFYYVVRLNELTPTEQLYARFCVTPATEYASARSQDNQAFSKDLFDSLEKEAGLKWVVRPDEEPEYE